MIGHAKTLVALIFIAGTLAQGIDDVPVTEDSTSYLSEFEITKDDASTTTTTTIRTPRDCEVNGVRHSEGSLVEGAGGECENCYCLNGEVTCSRTTCAPPLDGCKPVMQQGHCCPVKYDCDDGNRRVSVDQFFKDFPVKLSTADQRRQFDRMRPEWQTNMARKSPGGETIIADPENEQVSGVGHVGEAFLVHDFYELTTLPSIQDSSVFNVNDQIEVGTGVNVKGSISDAVAFGPILVFDNRVRTDRQHKDVNTTEVDVADDAENTVVTDIPEETTMLTKADNVEDEKVITDEATANTELLTDYDEGTQELTTLFPTFPFARDTTVKSLSELLSTATAASTVTTTDTSNVSSPAIDTRENLTGDDLDYTDIETNFPSYDITVGTSVLTTNQAQPPSSGVGEVIPVELKPEHKTPEIESAPEVAAERPSLLGTILNILTRTERPRPGRLPPPPPPRPPFRPRPRPNGRPHSRPDFIPPRFRFTPPPPVASERDTTEEPETNTATSPPAPLIPTTRPPLIVIPTSPPAVVVNRPVSGFNRPTPIINIPVHSATRPDIIPGHPGLPNRPDFLPNHPAAVAPQPDNHGLPSKPVIEGGFQGMRDNEEGIQPNFDFSDYDNNEEPTLPPSLPNLKIIPFVAADALVNQEIGIAGDEFLATPLILANAGDDNQDTQKPAETTEATTTTTTTTTRRPFLRLPHGDRRPPILPPRRTGVRPGDGSTTRRPFFRRPGERPSRPPFSSKTSTTTTTTTRTPEKEEPVGLPKPKPNFRPDIPFADRERSSTRPPFIPPRRHTPTPTTTTPTTTKPTTTKPTTTTPTTTPSTTTRRPKPFITSPIPIVSDDITNLLLQDGFGLSDGLNTPTVKFTPARTTPKPIIPTKISSLPEIPSAVRDQLPLATDPVLASGLLKLSGCNIYGRMYNVGDQITDLSVGCKECRCTPLGVQCLPIC